MTVQIAEIQTPERPVHAVREATQADREVVGELIDEFVAGHRMAYYVPINRADFLDMVFSRLDDPDSIVLLLDDDAGLFIGSIGQTNFAGQRVAIEVVWFARPKARGRGLLLCRAFEEWAKSRQAAEMYVAMPKPTPGLERFGFNLVDFIYQKKL